MHNPASFLLITASACALAALPALAEDFPQRKSGLWEIKTQSTVANIPPHALQLCIDQTTDNLVQQAASGATKNLCTKNDITHDGDRMVVDSVCKFGEFTATTHSVYTGNFDAAYRVETHSTYDPPMAGIKDGGAVIEAQWLSPCKADQRPGDLILSNGMKFNINDAQGTRPPTTKE